MEQAEFIDSLRAVILDGLVAELAEYWANPPGKLRTAERSQRSAWISGMSAADRELLQAFASEAAQTALFGMLCVLDGSRQIENPEKRGHLELHYINEGRTTVLASSNCQASVMPLHELL